MNLRQNSNTSGRLLGIDELQRYLNLGMATAKRIGKESGAFVKIGSRVLYDREKVDAYIDGLEHSQVERTAEKE